MPEPKELSIEKILAAVELSAKPDPGTKILVKRSGKAKLIPIQYLLNRLRAEYPGTQFAFGTAGTTLPADRTEGT